jgi:hypothetical protein
MPAKAWCYPKIVFKLYMAWPNPEPGNDRDLAGSKDYTQFLSTLQASPSCLIYIKLFY